MFTPTGDSQTISISGASVSASLPSDADAVRLRHFGGSSTVYVAFGDSTVVVSSSTGIPLNNLVGGLAEIFGVPRSATHIAAMGGTSGAVLVVTPGTVK